MAHLFITKNIKLRQENKQKTSANKQTFADGKTIEYNEDE